jgi:hypothetical protein
MHLKQQLPHYLMHQVEAQVKMRLKHRLPLYLVCQVHPQVKVRLNHQVPLGLVMHQLQVQAKMHLKLRLLHLLLVHHQEGFLVPLWERITKVLMALCPLILRLQEGAYLVAALHHLHYLARRLQQALLVLQAGPVPWQGLVVPRVYLGEVLHLWVRRVTQAGLAQILPEVD